MDRTVDVYINGSYVKKNNKIGGVQGEGNSTYLHITFDNGWSGLAKKVTFWDSKGENPVERTLTNDLLVDLTNSLLEYNVPIPPEPLAYGGYMTYIVDGYKDGVRQRSVQDTLSVRYALIADNAGEPADPTPTQAEQLQLAIEKILPSVQEETIKAQTAAETATQKATEATESAETATQKASEALKSAETAKTSETNAVNAAKSALNSKNAAEKAQVAAESAASSAKVSEENAAVSETNAKNSADTATNAKTVAEQAANTAASGASTATEKAKAAASSAEQAADSEVKAKTAETNAAASESLTEKNAILAKSYAVGGTGERAGENADNAKYYCEQAQAVVGGDFVTNVKLQETIAPITKSISDINTDLTAKGKAIAANTTEIGNVSKKATENATAIQNVAKSVPTTQKQAEWDEKVKSVNGKTGTAITIGAADVGAVAETDRNVIVDDVTGKKYKLGIQNGGLYYKEVTE